MLSCWYPDIEGAWRQAPELGESGSLIDNMYQTEIEGFSRCVERNSAPLVSGEDGLWSQKVVLACYESVKTGHSVKV